MPRFKLPGDEGDTFEGQVFMQGNPAGFPVRGEIEGKPTTPSVKGCFGLTADLSLRLQIPSSDWLLLIGPDELRRLKVTHRSMSPAGPIVVFQGDLESTGLPA